MNASSTISPIAEMVALDSTDAIRSGDFETIATSLIPSDIYILQGRLTSDGIPAFVVDGQMSQVQSLWSIATGGARLQVPSAFVERARQLLAELDAGHLALRDDEEEFVVAPKE